MASPIPPDPYEALGVPKDVELNAIRVAHRKLALKFHPDRIRDEADREKGKHEFQKIQQAYEILSDPVRRSRYDDKVRLAELRRERMTREPARPSVYTAKSSPAVRREYSEDGYFYEDRAPPASFYDEPAQGVSRKSDLYEPRRKSSTPKTDKREWSKWDGPVENITHKMANTIKTKAGSAKTKVAEKRGDKAEMRDREKRRDRAEKESSRSQPSIVDATDSELETVVPPKSASRREPSSRSKRSSEPQTTKSRRAPPSRTGYNGDESLEDEEKWERHHKSSRDYIRDSQRRPGLSRAGSSDAYMYWASESVVGGGRRSGSDSEKRPSSSRRTPADDYRAPPSMPGHTSAPSNLRPRMVDREPPRQSSAYAADRERGTRREPPSLSRSATTPIPSRASKKDSSAPSRGSNLKHAETQDSGYSSQSTPEMRGDSPPRESSRRGKSTRYTIVDDEAEEEFPSRGKRLGTRILDSDEDSSRRRTTSPETIIREPDRRDRDRQRPDGDSRSRSSRSQVLPELRTSVPRAEFSRDSASPRGSPPVNRHKLFGEVTDRSPDRYTYRTDPTQVRTSSYRSPQTSSYSSYRSRDEDDYLGPSLFDQKFPPSRRPSAAHAY